MQCRVTIAQGTLQGEERTSIDGIKYYSFEGIPYAKPPVGDLRFRDPQEPECWDSIRDATKPGSRCAQMNPYANKPFEGTEDCLYLNIYTPCLPREEIKKLPVIFFVHGGRLLVGYGDYYKPDFLIRHNIILVTINYRLNILGFLCLNMPEVPGNAGLKDTIMALKWVKNNIGHFNGDSNNITALGESAGAGIVTSYMTSNMADGYCHKIIAQSGDCISDLYIVDDDPIEKAQNIAAILGRNIKDKKELYNFFINVPVEELIFAFGAAEMNRPAKDINPYFTPVIETKFDNIQPFFIEHPLITIRQNRSRKLPILSGMSSHEGAYFTQRDANGNIIYENNLQSFIPKYLKLKWDSPQSLQIARNMREFYFKGQACSEKTKAEYIDFLTDVYCSDIVLFVDLLSKIYDKNNSNNNIYLYKFSYPGQMNTKTLKRFGLTGASHGDIIAYEFYRKAKAENCTDKDMEIVNFVTEAWCNFAKNGKPTWTNQEIEWLPYTANRRCRLDIDERLTLDRDMEWDRYAFWSKLGEKAKL